MNGEQPHAPAPLSTEQQAKMNAELKAKWLEALRSGKYAQGTVQLRYHDAYCCLGVLCDVVDPGGWRHHDYAYGEGEDEQEETSTLPFGLRCELGIPIDVETELIHMNDDNESTFAEIADFIEANL